MASSKPMGSGSSLSTQELAKEPMHAIPQRYVRLDNEPALSDDTSQQTIPIVDMKQLIMGDATDFELEKLHSTCKERGIFQILSNGLYNSVEHRATVNSIKDRISIAMFFNPKFEAVIGPAASLVSPQNPPLFKRVGMEKYFTDFFSRKLNGKSFLEQMRKIENEEDDIA